MDAEFEDYLGGLTEELLKKKLTEAIEQVLKVNQEITEGKEHMITEVQQLIKEVNAWTWMVAKHNRELYDQYRYHLFVSCEGVCFVGQGNEWDTDPETEV